MTKLMIALALVSAAASLQAQTIPNAELSQVKSETTLLKAKADEAAALRAVSEALGQSGGPTKVLDGGAAAPAEDPPAILGVFGPRGNTYAQLRLANGQHVNVRSGEAVPGGKWRVTIAGGSVRLIPIKRSAR